MNTEVAPHMPAQGPSLRPDSKTTAPKTEAFADLIHLGVTYRQLDYWCRTGMIALSTPFAGGSGNRRVVTPIERESIKALIGELSAIEARMRFLRSGDFFEAKVNELTHRAASEPEPEDAA